MNDNPQDYRKVDVLIVGAGPAGLAAAIAAKHRRPELAICVIDKGAAPGNHALSGAVLEPGALARLLDPVRPGWQESDEAGAVLLARVESDDVLWLPGHRRAVSLLPLLKTARLLGLGYGRMIHGGDYICSVSRLAAWLGKIAQELGVEVLPGFAAADLLWDQGAGRAAGVKLVDQGRDKEGRPQRNFLAGETISADFILLAEGCDGLLSEKFITMAGLQRAGEQLYSLGVKELIRVSDEQYAKFGDRRVVHAMGFPLWTPLSGPDVFGGGIMYPMGENRIAVGIIAGLDYRYHDFNPQNALSLFKEHHYVKQFIDGGTLVETGAKMIPEGGWEAVPRCPQNGTVGKGNVVLLGDAAGLVNMLKIKGLHNAIESGLAAAEALAANGSPEKLAAAYTAALERAGVVREMAAARNFRQCIARFGTTAGLLLAAAGRLLPRFKIKPDYTHLQREAFPRRAPAPYDKDTFTALARTGHREEEPCHLLIGDEALCRDHCLAKFNAPCITFCPAGVYEKIGPQPRPANPSNCLHCKTCQRKCPFDNIRWTVPEGGEGPRYTTM
ncbi:electron-transfer flavoprotein:ubiquinone oxidoreductase [Desulfurivibrio alkaliphilus]|uniref:Electron transfer flavoprotein-ubiquinone oxidoreductase n=1 Tax=Desulfurivibrio alkaliphilus (strain DSM 19089 / UNIQEM U267 / AHT2) TaxID=589865 RepID=D6Z626_DESAT|nr:electron-transfer flavoprotein:ubiquinone oxidoreductase [Desulfurivibrio alkaliphilus]ADH84908.1 Electron-transferring-flavoprotein dehydrogenase [Desulfurivibrio alkaliphilus AHT 2]